MNEQNYDVEDYERKEPRGLLLGQILEVTYGSPRLGNPQDPLDDLVYIVLSNKTAPKVAIANYTRVEILHP